MRRVLFVGVAGVAVAALTLRAALGDYPVDAGPTISALTAGHPLRALQLQPLMGSLSILVRAPFALAARLAGGDALDVYRAGVAPCLVALAVVGAALARRRGDVVPLLLAVATPASYLAVQSGHPEELLAAALCVAAALLCERRALWAGLALGLALATKQWAVLAFAPVVLAAPRAARVRLGVTALAVAALFTVPLAVANPSAFRGTTTNAATSPTVTTRANVWYPAAAKHVFHIHAPAGVADHVTVAQVPELAARISHPLIVLLSPLVALLFFWRRGFRRGDVLGVLALVLLLRCVLDPVDAGYYHAPFLLALLAFEVETGREVWGLPPLTLLSAGGLWLTFIVLDAHGADPALTNAVYLGWTAVVGLALLQALRVLPLSWPVRPGRRARALRST